MEIDDSVLTATQPDKAKIDYPLEKKSLKFLWWIVVSVLIIFGGRIIYLDVVKGDYYQQIAKENRIRALLIKAPRGKIYDRSGKVLVNNVPSLDAIILPADLPQDSGERKEETRKISQILALNEADIWGAMENIQDNTLDPVLLKSNISQDESLIILERKKELPGVMIEKTAVREYINSAIYSRESVPVAETLISLIPCPSRPRLILWSTRASTQRIILRGCLCVHQF